MLGGVGFDQQVIDRYRDAAPAAPAPPPPAADFVVMIDPGHGGEDPGAIAADGTYESDIVLDVSRRVRDRLARVEGIAAKMTRDSNYFVPLRARQAKASEAQADLFVGTAERRCSRSPRIPKARAASRGSCASPTKRTGARPATSASGSWRASWRRTARRRRRCAWT
ncbi:MAG: N-acetylmuramoyl-L-alanine amidase [Betaproteobacteria bacterium AqS2]|uniref:N-acetylmuramoyl-L-alanine amidase n=1 Tax=Candidatus Amphirhobacter heronislandensis TaxID=1732024 RepID=A0A930UAZ7_9GAMM|nr:N-acetylmuramoyl-L-alanine amidase [Betaproteobacteria bacterium AqS2]